jgi:hypothetical protein
MSKKFDAEAYVASWDAKVIPAMIAVIVVSLVLVVILNVATRPDCLRHEYVFCGTEAAQAGHHSGGADAHGKAHGANPH